ncbi:MAG: GNAT family N-acetyltransferase [Acidiferrobacterales bacterium]
MNRAKQSDTKTESVSSKRGERWTFAPLTAERWKDFEALVGPRGAYGGCWCMLWRCKRSQWEAQKGEGNHQAMKAIVESGDAPGLLAYDGREPIGWCSVAPRSAFPALARSRVLKPIDNQAIWSVSCFFIRKSHRHQGVSVALLRAACDFVRTQGGTIVEGYPVEPRKERYPQVYAWTGFARTFIEAGFTECLRRSETRPIMRRVLDDSVSTR